MLLGGLILLYFAAFLWEYWQVSRDAHGYLLRRFGSGLGKVTSAEVISLGPIVTETLEPNFPNRERYRRWPWSNDTYFVHRRQTIRGENAARLAALWRAQEFRTDYAACHDPGYVVRFYLGPWKRAEITLCWFCSNAGVPILFHEAMIGFDAHGTNGIALLTELKQVAPLPSDDDFSYTNAPLSSMELEKKLEAVFTDGWYWDFVEWANHSPQRNEIISEVLRRMNSDRAHDVKTSMRLAASFRLTNAVPTIVPFLRHTNEELRGSAISALLELRVPLDEKDLFPLLASANPSERNWSLHLLVENTKAGPPQIMAAARRSISMFGKDAFSVSVRERLSRMTNTSPEWMPLVQLLSHVIKSDSSAIADDVSGAVPASGK